MQRSVLWIAILRPTAIGNILRPMSNVFVPRAAAAAAAAAPAAPPPQLSAGSLALANMRGYGLVSAGLPPICRRRVTRGEADGRI